MNVKPIITVVFGFRNLKEQSDFNATVVLDKYKLYCVGYKGWMENGWFISKYHFEGLPKDIVAFLKSEEILDKLI